MLMTEIYKILNKLAPPIMDLMLNMRNITYNLRNLQEFLSGRKETVFNGLETLSYRAPQLWTLSPEEIGQRNTINLFNSQIWICKDIKQWIYGYTTADVQRVSLQIIQSVRTKPRIYLTYGSYLGTIYLNCLNCMRHFIYI